MTIPTMNEVADEPSDDLAMVNGLIARKEAGEPVDGDIQALLDDMERVGLTNTEAYAVLDAYRPGQPIAASNELAEEVPSGEDDVATPPRM